MEKIPLIVNPLSKRNRTRLDETLGRFNRIGRGLIELKTPRRLEEIGGIARECRSMRAEYLIVSGGDGSIHQTVTAFIKEYHPEPPPPILILKDGTINNISASLRIRGSGREVLRRFVSMLENRERPRILERDTMRIGGRYCFLFGTGVTTNLLDAIYEGSSKDIPKVLLVAARAFWEGFFLPERSRIFKRFSARVVLDGEELGCRDFMGILAGTVGHVGIGFRLLERKGVPDGRFRAIATGIRPALAARRILSLRAGGTIDHPLHFDRLASRMEIAADEGFEYTMDGDMYRADRMLTVETGPRMRFISI